MNLKYSEKPSQEFLDELIERARRLGWYCDYTEICYFVEELNRQAGVVFEMPEPYNE